MERISILIQQEAAFLQQFIALTDLEVNIHVLDHGLIPTDLGEALFYYAVDFADESLSFPHGMKYYIFSEAQTIDRTTVVAINSLKEKGFKGFFLEEKLTGEELGRLLSPTMAEDNDIHQQHALVLDSMGDALILLDQDMQLVLINQAAKQLIGVQSESAVPKLTELFRLKKDGLPIDVTKLLEKLKDTKQPLGLKSGTVLVTQDDQEKYISANLAPVLGEKHKKLKGFILIFRDVTRMVNAEMRIKLFSDIIRTSTNYTVITDTNLDIIYTNDYFDKAFQEKGKVLFTKDLKTLKQFKNIDFEYVLTQLKRLTHYTQEMEIVFDTGGRSFLMQATEHETRANNVVYYFNFIDIHEQRRIENTLAHERRVFQDVFDHSPIGIAIVDSHHKMVQINEAFRDMFRVKKKSVIGYDFGTLIDCKNKNTLQECGDGSDCETCMTNEMVRKIIGDQVKILGSEFSIKRFENGRIVESAVRMSGVPVEQGNQLRALILFEDITKTKEFEKILIRNERQLRVITDNMQEAVSYLSSDGTILYASPSHETLLGYTPEELVGYNFFNLIEEDEHHETREQLYNRIHRKSVYSTELSLKRRDGTTIWVETTGNLLKNDDLSDSLILVSRDISIKHKTLEEMERVKEMAIAANRAKSEFLANMSHEIRTPMNGIVGMTNLTLLTDLDDNQRENLQMVRSSADSLLKIINSILDFSKIEAGKLTVDAVEFQLDTLLDRLTKTFHIQTQQKNIEFRVVAHGDIKGYLLGDMNRLTQILNNLIGNAIKFTDTGYIELRVLEKSKTYNETHLLFELEDTGVGIDPRYQNKIFESFSQADGSITRRFGGTGLGLAISKQLVELLGGHIGFISESHKGTTFYFDMAFKRINKEASAVVYELDGIPEAAYRASILLVEDDRINQILAKRLLDKQGHEVTIAENGQIAVELAGKTAFDMILMDIQMPVMDGIEATQRIRTMDAYKNTPIIALTAYAIKGDRDRFLEVGMDEYISKPIDMAAFYKVVNDLLRRKVETKQTIPVEKDAPLITPSEVEAFHMEFTKNLDLAVLNAKSKQYENLEKHAHFMKVLCVSMRDENLKRKAIKLELAARREEDELINAALEALKGVYKEKIKSNKQGEGEE